MVRPNCSENVNGREPKAFGCDPNAVETYMFLDVTHDFGQVHFARMTNGASYSDTVLANGGVRTRKHGTANRVSAVIVWRLMEVLCLFPFTQKAFAMAQDVINVRSGELCTR